MNYVEFKNIIEAALRKKSSGATWHELRAAHDLPYDRPCPEWTRRLEKEIGLIRRKGNGRSLIWSIRR